MHDVSELTADLFISLDGFAGAVDVGPYFGYGGPELDEWIQTEIEKPQVIVFGRVTYAVLAPMATNGADPASRRLTALPKVVVSSTLSEPLAWANTRLVAGNAVEVLPAVKADSELPLRTMGSISLVRNLTTAGLVDRLRLMVFPLTCGSAGREHIFGEGKPERMQLEQTRVLDGRIVLLEYRTSA
jgi:dihydrofolate reductase